MASNLVLNGVSYVGTPGSLGSPFKPTSLSLTVAKIGVTLIAANGARTFISRSTAKRTWVIGWELADEITRAAVRALSLLATTWTFVDQLGVSYTVQTEQDDYSEEFSLSDLANNPWYRLQLTVREQ